MSLFDFLSRRYDVVATNPPYMGSKNMGSVVKRYVEEHFPSGKRDLYAAFILRCLELAQPETGRVAMVTQQSWMFLRSFADLRALDEEKLKKATGFKGILRETSIETLAHLGPGAFQGRSRGEVVNIVLFTLAKTPPETDHRLTAFRLIGPKSPEEKADYWYILSFILIQGHFSNQYKILSLLFHNPPPAIGYANTLLICCRGHRFQVWQLYVKGWSVVMISELFDLRGKLLFLMVG